MEKTQGNLTNMPIDVIIEKTIFASVMDNGFWHRWIVHGIDEDFVKENKIKMINLEGWTETLKTQALDYSKLADDFKGAGEFSKAEYHYRKAGIYFNLAQWVFPNPSGARVEWYKLCLEQFELADKVTSDNITRHSLKIGDKKYEGRVRIPNGDVNGVVVLVMPTDSTKEEFFLYEKDFIEEGFVVVAFDGAGQGETLLINGHKADIESWDQFMDGLIEFVYAMFPNLSINLFGTSSGGAWAIEGGKNPLVSKVVTVSPPPKYISNIRLPDYFRERMSNMLVDFSKGCLPSFDNVEEIGNVLVIHGGKDLLVNADELVGLYERFAPEKRFITYEEEGHCCNFKLGEIRQRVSQWFKGGDINEI